MSFRYSRKWTEHSLGLGLMKTLGWQHAAPRVGNLFPGITSPIPTGTVPTFKECINHRVEELLKAHETIIVLWSGGVDSTLVALALAHAKTKKHDIHITVTEQALSDAGKLILDTLLKKGCKPFELTVPALKEAIKNGAMVIHGSHADSITLGEFADRTDIHDEIWDMSLPELLVAHSKGVTDIAKAEFYIERLEPLISLMPLEMNTLNVAFWLDFTCCWSFDEYQFKYRLDLGTPDVDYCGFYNSDLFQRWAMQDVREKIKRGDTKYQALDYIKSITKADLRFKKNFISDDIRSDDYENTIFNERLLFINEDYSLTFL